MGQYNLSPRVIFKCDPGDQNGGVAFRHALQAELVTGRGKSRADGSLDSTRMFSPAISWDRKKCAIRGLTLPSYCTGTCASE